MSSKQAGGKCSHNMNTIRQRILKFAIIVMLNVLILSLMSALAHTGPAFGGAVQALSSRGSSGREVEQIQQRLKSWDYYAGEVSGVYDAPTEEAVRYFQRKNGLTQDGVAGPATLAALGLPAAGMGGETDADWRLLARIISAEARGEPYQGQVAVGAVVLNRVEHPSFPDSVAGVVYQAGAFTALTDGQFEEPVEELCYLAAKDALNGLDPSGGALYYFNPDKTDNQWMHARPVIVRIGQHLFCD